MVNWATKETMKQKWNDYGLNSWRNDFGRPDLNTVDWLAANIPGHRWEECDCGAAWKDYATLRRATVMAPTDVYDALSVRKAFYDASYAMPPAQLINLLEWRGPSDAEMPVALRSTMTGAVWWGMTTGWTGIVLPSDMPSRIQPMMDNLTLYTTRLRPLVREADLYHILPRPDGTSWDGIEYYNPANVSGAVMLFKPTTSPDTRTIPIKGLDRAQTYAVTFQDRPAQNVSLTGAQLMDNGLSVTLTGTNQSEIIWLKGDGATANEAVGANVLAPAPRLTLFPSPCSGTLQLNINGTKSAVEVVVYNVAGKVIQSFSVNRSQKVSFSKTLPNGVYFARLMMNHKAVQTTRFLLLK
jgi:hypothetical protein